MKTRNQTKKRKLDIEERKIPQLNEYVLGVILKHVVRKQQIHARKILRTQLSHLSSLCFLFRETDGTKRHRN